jgi:Protein of unknown function (DUF1501)
MILVFLTGGLSHLDSLDMKPDRTPRIGASTGNNNARDGRDHWAAVFSAALAGGGVQGGQTIGRSDKIGAYLASRPYAPMLRPILPRPSTRASESILPPRFAIA